MLINNLQSSFNRIISESLFIRQLKLNSHTQTIKSIIVIILGLVFTTSLGNCVNGYCDFILNKFTYYILYLSLIIADRFLVKY